MAVLLALLSAIAYGSSDYVGGRASRTTPPVVIAFTAETMLLAVLALIVPIVESDGPTWQAVGWGAFAGFAGSLGVLGLYVALARGNMTVVAPITGIVAAVVPIGVGLLLGERPGVTAALGIGLALVAVALTGGVVSAAGQRVQVATIAMAIAIGACFGTLFVALARTGDGSGTWPLLASRLGGTPLLLVALMLRRRQGALPAFAPGWIAVGASVGALVGVANGAYLLATREGMLSVVAVIASMYPAMTVVLAMTLDHERASRSQLCGMALAVPALTLITLGG